jgi:co-chaperonin GroES (HSP10)
MSLTLNPLKGKLQPIKKNVIVTDMYFGEQTTKGGLILRDDDGTTRGIYPRWARVHAKGPENTDKYQVGDWVLVEHGRWTRSVEIDEGAGQKELRMIDVDAILMWSDRKPEGIQIGNEYNNGSSATVNVPGM